MQAGHDQTQRREQERPRSLRKFHSLLMSLVHSDRDVKELKPFGPLAQRCCETQLLGHDHRRGLMTDQRHLAASSDQALDGTSQGVQATREEDDVVRDEASIYRAREIQMVLQPTGSRVRMPDEFEHVVVIGKEAQRSDEQILDV
jgi:hypothetical protein